MFIYASVLHAVSRLSSVASIVEILKLPKSKITGRYTLHNFSFGHVQFKSTDWAQLKKIETPVYPASLGTCNINYDCNIREILVLPVELMQ